MLPIKPEDNAKIQTDLTPQIAKQPMNSTRLEAAQKIPQFRTGNRWNGKSIQIKSRPN